MRKVNCDSRRNDAKGADQFHRRWESMNQAVQAAVAIEELVAHGFIVDVQVKCDRDFLGCVVRELAPEEMRGRTQ